MWSDPLSYNGIQDYEAGWNLRKGLRMSFTHLDETGRARMVDLTGKTATHRRALAAGSVRMQASTLDAIRRQQLGKGDVLTVAKVAGVMAAKRCAEFIPLCHPLGLSSVDLEFALVERAPQQDQSHAGLARLDITACCRVTGPTGVEMEALTAVSVAALTIYDMCKSMDKLMIIERVRLLEKDGGKSGSWRRREQVEDEFDAG